jgi:hypothetical protein
MVEKISKNKDKSKKNLSKKNKSLSIIPKNKNKSKSKKLSIKSKKTNQKGGGELVDKRDWKQRTLDSIKLLENPDELSTKPKEQFGKFPYPDCTIS